MSYKKYIYGVKNMNIDDLKIKHKFIKEARNR